MTGRHRPLSEWVAEVGLDPEDGTASWDPWAEPNLGDRNADARGEPRFRAGWRRVRIPLEWSGTRVGVLGLARPEPEAGAPEAVVELTDAGVPLPVGEAAVAVVERLEDAWPDVRPEQRDLQILAGESPALRWALLERLSREGDPAAELFHILPWELVERLAADLVAAVEAGGGASGGLLMHWFSPTGSMFGAAMDEMNLWLRDHGPSGLAEHGGAALCEELARADLARFPGGARRALAALTERLGALDPALRQAAQAAADRLSLAGPAAGGTDAKAVEAVTDWLRGLPPAGPGEHSAERGRVHVHLAVTAGESGGDIALEVTPHVGAVPVLVRAEDDEDAVIYLGLLTDGRMSLHVDFPPPYELRPATRRRAPGAAPAAARPFADPVDALDTEPRIPELALADDRPEEPRPERLLVVPHLDLDVTAYESRDGVLLVSASSASREADGRWLRVVIHDRGAGVSTAGVIPLRWVHDAAEGALAVGTWHDRLTVAVSPELVDDPLGFTREAVRWSKAHAADERTREALRDLLARLGDLDGPS